MARSNTRTNTTTTTTTSTSSSSRRYTADSLQLCFLGQIFCGVVLILDYVMSGGRGGYYAYSLAVAIVAIVLALVAVGLYSGKDDVYNRELFDGRGTGSITVAYLLTKFLVLWWSIGAFVLTFNGPYQFTSNGYFALWGGLVFAVGAMGDGVTGHSKMSSFSGLLICAIVLLSALPRYIGGNGGNSGEALFALIVAIVTVLLFLVFTYAWQPSSHTVQTVIFGILALLWVVVPFVVTFRGPFKTTGNGYFASWIGALCAVVLATG